MVDSMVVEGVDSTVVAVILAGVEDSAAGSPVVLVDSTAVAVDSIAARVDSTVAAVDSIVLPEDLIEVAISVAARVVSIEGATSAAVVKVNSADRAPADSDVAISERPRIAEN